MPLLAGPLLALALSAAASGGPGSGAPPGNKPDPDATAAFQSSPSNIKFFYEDVYEPLFTKAAGRDGRPVWRSEGGASIAMEFPAEKAPGVFRVAIVGESVGLRFFEDADAMRAAWSRLLKGRPVELVSFSVAGYDGPRVLMRLKEALTHEPDLVVILTGNNENQDPASEPSEIKRFAVKYAAHSEMLRAFQGFLGRRVERKMRAPEEMLALYKKNLAEMARLAAAREVPVVFCALPRNLAGAPPANVLPLWDETFFRAWSAHERGDDAAAEKLFAAYQAADPGAPLGHYARALALRRLKRLPEAAAEFRAAVERSIKGSRPSMNAALKETAAASKAAVADFEAAFAALAPDGLPDDTMFDDEVHWHRSLNLYLNALVEKAFADNRGLWPWKGARAAETDAQALAADEKAGRALAAQRDVKDDARRALLNGVWLWSTDPQRVDEKSVASFDIVYRLAPGELDQLMRPEVGEDIFRTLSTNWWTKDKTERVKQIWPQVLDCLAEMYRRRGRPADAAKALRIALDLDPKRPLTRLRLALAERELGQAKAARKDYELARPFAADFPEIRLYGAAYFSGRD